MAKATKPTKATCRRKGIPRRLGRRTRRVAPSRSPLMPVPPASYFLSRSGAPAVEPSFPRGQPGLHLAHQIEGAAKANPVAGPPHPVGLAERSHGIGDGPDLGTVSPGGRGDPFGRQRRQAAL